MKDGVGLDPRKHNFQQTVGSLVIARNCEMEKNPQMIFFAIQSVL